MTDETTPIEPIDEPLELAPVPRALVARQAHAFSSFTQFTEAPLGQTVAQMVADLGFPQEYDAYVHVWINDLPLDRDQWECVIPAEGQMVYVRVVPQGGGGGKDILRTIASIAIAVVAFYAAPLLMGYAAGAAGWAAASAAGFGSYLAVAGVAAGITILGNMALNAIIPPPKLELDFGNGVGSQRNQLTGSSNRYAPYAPIPRIFGRRRVYPLLAGRPYSETQGDNEYLRMALLVGWGPLQISDIRIGETPITSFADVQYEVREGWSNDSALTLYTSTITEAGYSIVLSPAVGASYTYNTRTTDAGVTEISVDVTAPAGIAKFESNGNRTSIDVDVQVQYAVAGTGNWQTPVWLNSSDTGLDVNGRIRISGADTSTMRRTGRFTVSSGQYDVRLYRSTTEYATNQHVQEVRWTAMRSVKPSYPVQQSGLALIALRMKATGQLNGVPQQINCLAESYLPVYNGTSWNYAITRNPAWAFADVLRRRGGQTYLPDSRIDLTSILAWANACAATAPNASEPYWNFDAVVEGGAVFQVLRQIASSARANYTIRDGKHSVVRDIQQTVPIQHITPRNSFGYSGTKQFLDYPHALRVVFTNAAKNYEEDERIVYDDGYSAGNATKFETLELYGCTSATQAYREGRYFIAAARLRPETHMVSMDIENLRCNIGDLVQFQHDVVSIGIAAARIVSITGSVIVLDQEMACSAGTSYALRVRKANGDTVIVSLQDPGAGTTATLTATSSLVGIAADDLVMFGVSTSVSVPMIVKRIEPGPDFTAKLHLVDAQSGVYTADTGTIPAFQSNITTTAAPEEQRPGTPSIASVRSDDTVALLLSDGTVQVRIAVSIAPPASSTVSIQYFDVQWRAVGAANYIEERYPRGTPIFLAPVQFDVTYEIRARAVSTYGVAGNWSGSTTHTVIGKDRPPADVVNLAAALKPGVVEIKWDAAADADYDYTELRYGPVWSTATVLWKGAASTYSWPRPVNATYKVWAAHRDTSANYSATPASVDVTVTNAIDPQRTILLTIYRRSPAASTPPLPSVDASYDFSTNALTGLDNSWQTTAPTGTDPLWVSTATTTGNITDTITPAEWSAATILLQDGTAGLTTAVVELFQRTATSTAPSVTTTGTATYTFATGAITGQPAGWSNTVPASGGGYLWVIRATAAATGATDTIANTEWAVPALVAQDGATGNSTALVYIYQRSPTQPTLPSNTVTYTFATGNIATLNNGWSATVPAGTDPLWLAVASAVSNTGTDTIAANEWTTPVVLVQNGAAGLNTAIVYIYQRAGSQPALPTLTTTFTFATGALTGLNNGWSNTIPAGTNPLYVAAATASSSDTTDSIAANEWTTPVVLAQNGTPGDMGFSSATVMLYQRTSTNSAPGVSTTGSATYTFASGAIANQPTGWTLNVPDASGGAYLWSIQATAVSNFPQDTIGNAEWSAPVLVTQNGIDGANATNTAIVYLYQRAASAPSVPSNTVTYTFATSALSPAPNNGWSTTIPAGTNPLYVCAATASSTGASDSIASNEWSTPVILAQNGTPGDTGFSSATVLLYRRTTTNSAPSVTTTGNATYTFASGAITGQPSGWTLSVPDASGGAYLWSIQATAVSNFATDTIGNAEWSAPVLVVQDGAPGANGLNTATVYLFQRTSSATAPSLPSAQVTYTFASSVATGVDNGWTQTMPATGGAYRWMTTATAAATGATDTIAASEWAAAALIAQDGTPGSPGGPGADGKQTGTVYLYQWSSAQPANPSGTTAFVWGSASHTGYTGGNGWSTTVGNNPGTPLIQLWVASKAISETAGVAATTVSWASGFTVAAWAINGNNGNPGSPGSPGGPGANGVQSAQPTVYQWAISIPLAPSGTADYVWSNASFGAAPNSWSLTPGTSPSLGYTLWGATVTVTDSAANSTTQFNWSAASITARGYAGSNGSPGAPGGPGDPGQQGASARTCFARIANNPSPVSGTITVTGDNRPLQASSFSVWGLNVAWSATDPDTASTNTLYQSDGIYDPATGNTVWATPYISSLKVGSLSAITVNTGALTVNGVLTVATGGMVMSQNYAANSTGWAIKPDGTAEFNNVKVRGDVQANSIVADTIDTPALKNQAVTQLYATNSSGTTVTLNVYVPANCSGAIVLASLGPGYYQGGNEGQGAYFPTYGSLLVDDGLVVDSAAGSIVWSVANPVEGWHTVRVDRSYSGAFVMTLAVLIGKR